MATIDITSATGRVYVNAGATTPKTVTATDRAVGYAPVTSWVPRHEQPDPFYANHGYYVQGDVRPGDIGTIPSIPLKPYRDPSKVGTLKPGESIVINCTYSFTLGSDVTPTTITVV